MSKTKQKSSSKDINIHTHIHIKGARSNNLKDIELLLPKNKLVVVTGLSGSGKSSLIMDTLYAEGQRRYVESLSSYARQFMNRMKKPDLDFIKGLCPAIAIEQRVSTSNARSTVGSLTELYDFLRLLYARIGVTYSPVSGEVVKKHTVSDVVDAVSNFKDGIKLQLFAPTNRKYSDRTVAKQLELLMQKGYSRVLFNGNVEFIEDVLEDKSIDLERTLGDFEPKEFLILIDRFAKNNDEEFKKRLADSILTAIQESEGDCYILDENGDFHYFNNRFELDGMTFLEPNQALFNFNNPYGACPRCEGYGQILGIDPKKVIPDESKSVYEGAVNCWKGEKSSYWLDNFIRMAKYVDFPIHKPYSELTKAQIKQLWDGHDHCQGIYDFFEELKEKTYKIQNRILLARYRGKTKCTECDGGRLRKDASYVKVGGMNIMELTELSMEKLLDFFKNLEISEHQKSIAKRILFEIESRLQVMINVGLNYLNLDRIASSLSGGETQRIHLTRTLGSNLTNSLYILDEPSIGLHPKDTEKLIKVLKSLRDLKNTVVVVEHEEDIIRNADSIVDIGPEAGIYGGELVYSGDYDSFLKTKTESLTKDYLTGQKQIPLPEQRRTVSNKIRIENASQHNLKNINVEIPVNAFSVVTGVSGSGKSTLIGHILYPALKQHFGEALGISTGKHTALRGDLSLITQVEMINQKAIGKSSRSNPITYVKAFDGIRKLLTEQQISKIRGYKPKHFSFNVEGGRCETCKGDGEITVEMQFLADVKLQCDDCHGKRFKSEILEVSYNDKNIDDILNLSVSEALEFFADKADIYKKIKPLDDVGLGYVKLGQASSTLSGGEAQRIKLASYLSKERSSEKIFFIFDEPTTGLHFHDINKLLLALNALVEKGHTVLVVEHNLDVIKCADWVIDLGPEGGDKGGDLVFQGRPEDLIDIKASYTGQFLKDKL